MEIRTLREAEKHFFLLAHQFGMFVLNATPGHSLVKKTLVSVPLVCQCFPLDFGLADIAHSSQRFTPEGGGQLDHVGICTQKH